MPYFLNQLRFVDSKGISRQDLPDYLNLIQTILPIQYWIRSLFLCKNVPKNGQKSSVEYSPLSAFPSTNPDAEPANSREKIFNTLGFRALISLVFNEDDTIKKDLFNKNHASALIAFLEAVYQNPSNHEENERLFQQALKQLKTHSKINMVLHEPINTLTPIPLSTKMTQEIRGEDAAVTGSSTSTDDTTAAEAAGRSDAPAVAIASQSITGAAPAPAAEAAGRSDVPAVATASQSITVAAPAPAAEALGSSNLPPAAAAGQTNTGNLTPAIQPAGNTNIPTRVAVNQTYPATPATDTAEASSTPAHAAADLTGVAMATNIAIGWVNTPPTGSSPGGCIISIRNTAGGQLVALTTLGTISPLIAHQGQLYLPTVFGNLLVQPLQPNFQTSLFQAVQASTSRLTFTATAATPPTRGVTEQSSAFRCVSGPNVTR